MGQEFNTLVKHGAAPYQHDEKNGLSYFAVVQGEGGNLQTLWGVDIERSLEEAGAEVGDAVALVRGGKELVTINERQPDGTVIEKTADRFIWKTEIQLDELEVTQPREAQVAVDELKGSVDQAGRAGGTVKGVEDGRFAVMAPYWLNGLHNKDGLALAEEINQVVKKHDLEKDHGVLSIMLNTYPNAKRFGLEVVSKSRYLDDLHRKANGAEPRFLLDGAFVRDKDGQYRPAAGGRVVLVDGGDSLVLKSKSAEGYRAAMELAIAKGWTAIELKGKPAMLADAWLEAKLKGLDVVNYSPSKADLAKYGERMAAAAQAKGGWEDEPGVLVVKQRLAEQGPERVETRTFVDADGENKIATVVYTISCVGSVDVEYGNPKDAAKAFAGISAGARPMVMRSMVRVDGEPVNADIIAVTAPNILSGARGQMVKRVEGLLDTEFNEAFAEVIAEEKVQDSLGQEGSGVSAGIHSGRILAIEGGQVVQKVGRDPGTVVRHDISMLSKVPKVGDVVDIRYVDGMGQIGGQAKSVETSR